MEKRSLGKGLSALIPPKETVVQTIDSTSAGQSVVSLPISSIKANKYQPRVDFNQDKLKELMDSIREKGVVQPVLVRKATDGYELIAGERRLRAVSKLGYDTIPAIIKDVGDLDMLEISLIENIQRAELNPLEEANSFQKFITDFNFTQDKIAQVLGKDRSTVANTLRLLMLPKKIQDFLAKESITAGHAKALLALSSEKEQLRMCNLIMKKGLSVREVENRIVKKRLDVGSPKPLKDQSIVDIEETLQRILGTRVRILHGKKRGHIQIEYYSTEDLNRILDILESKK
ncbi:MAG: ParB/RepB/Spo0J family partition protein [Candidatus Omnitrophica bacterium]|nr:ParB/RepB/Spo0J family partition protein [Candidatus Omnitrophota bacterium]